MRFLSVWKGFYNKQWSPNLFSRWVYNCKDWHDQIKKKKNCSLIEYSLTDVVNCVLKQGYHQNKFTPTTYKKQNKQYTLFLPLHVEVRCENTTNYPQLPVFIMYCKSLLLFNLNNITKKKTIQPHQFSQYMDKYKNTPLPQSCNVGLLSLL